MENNPVDTAAKIFEPFQRLMKAWTDLHDSTTAPLKRLTEVQKQLGVAMYTATLLPTPPRWPKGTRRLACRLARQLARRMGPQRMN
jgi:hypothetical protein